MVAVAGLTLYLLIVFCGRLADRFTLWPSRGFIEAGDAQAKKLASPDGVVEVWVARSPSAKKRGEPRAYILRFYGNAARADQWVAREAASWNQREIELWGVNYPGFGGSSGNASLEGVAKSALIAYQALSKVSHGKPIFVIGTSMGTTAALTVSARYKVSGIFLQDPLPLAELIRGEKGWWNLWLLALPVSWQVPSALDSIGNAKKTTAPGLFVMSGRDEVIPYQYQLLVANAFSGKKTLVMMPNAHHGAPIQGEAKAIVNETFAKWWEGIPY